MVAALSFVLPALLQMFVVGVAAVLVSPRVRGTARTLLWTAVGLMVAELLVVAGQFALIQSRSLGLVSVLATFRIGLSTVALVLLVAAVGAGRRSGWTGGAPGGPPAGYPATGYPAPSDGQFAAFPSPTAAPYPGATSPPPGPPR